MSRRLGGKKVQIPNQTLLDKIHLYQLADMAEAVKRYDSRWAYIRTGIREVPRDQIKSEMLNGNKDMDAIMQRADELIDEAVLVDPRLVRRAAWERAEDGIDACPALLAAGDERPCFDRRKRRISDRATQDRCRVVISTDSRDIRPENAAAFIAAAKLSQQFRPLDLWWQGAWLRETPGPERGYGHIFHVPLVSGDLDFRRLQFVLSNGFRDHVSFSIMVSYAFPAGKGWGAGVGEWSYLVDTDDFVRESGISATPKTVAHYAAKWAGMEPLWQAAVSESAAEQRWDPVPYTPDPITDADRKRWAEQDARRERERIAAGRDRLREVC